MSGYLLILAIICLGGAIATIGDRLGSRVGKARLSLFKMRPKQTAVLVTILTGSIISSLTLGILLATSSQLRDGLIRIGEIRQKSRLAEKELKDALAQKRAAEIDSQEAQVELDRVVNRLRSVNRSLNNAVLRQKRSELQLRQLQTRFNQAQVKLKQTELQATGLRTQISRLSETSQKLKTEQAALIQQRNQSQQNLASANSKRLELEQAVQQAQVKLNDVERQKQRLESAVTIAQSELERAREQEQISREELLKAESTLAQASSQRNALLQDIQQLEENRKRLEQNVLNLLVGLRQGNIAIRAGQVLASDVIENATSRETALQAINRLLGQARIEAIVRINSPDATPERAIIYIAPQFVEQMLKVLSDGDSHFVRIISANNYFLGEEQVSVAVIPQIVKNQLIFKTGETLSSVELTPAQLNEDSIISKVESLFVLANRRAIQKGIPPDPLTGQVGEFSTFKLFKFATALKAANDAEPVQVYTVASNNTFASGPLILELIAVKDNEILLRSN